jgi:hypothetical protein
MFSVVLCSASSRLCLRSTLRVAALTAPPRSSKGRIYVMADEACPQFCVDPAHGRSYRMADQQIFEEERIA